MNFHTHNGEIYFITVAVAVCSFVTVLAVLAWLSWRGRHKNKEPEKKIEKKSVRPKRKKR